MDIFWEELTSGLPDARQLVHVLIRMIAATVLGAVVGRQREKAGKPAGLRTHMLVSLGTAVVVLACSGVGMSPDGVSRVVQGIVTGIGFLGAGAILKLDQEREIQGLMVNSRGPSPAAKENTSESTPWRMPLLRGSVLSGSDSGVVAPMLPSAIVSGVAVAKLSPWSSGR